MHGFCSLKCHILYIFSIPPNSSSEAKAGVEKPVILWHFQDRKSEWQQVCFSGSLVHSANFNPVQNCSYQEWHEFFYDAPHFCVLFTCVILSKQLSAFFVVKDLEILLWNVLCVVSAAWRYGSFLEASQADLVVTFCKNSCQWNWTDWIWAGSWGVDVWDLDKNDVDICFSFCRNTFWVDVTLWLFLFDSFIHLLVALGLRLCAGFL